MLHFESIERFSADGLSRLSSLRAAGSDTADSLAPRLLVIDAGTEDSWQEERKGDMNKKKTRKSKAAKSMRDLPEKAVSAKTAKNVKGGSISLNYGQINYEYKPQKPDGNP